MAFDLPELVCMRPTSQPKQHPPDPIRVMVVEDDDRFRAAFVAAVQAAPDTVLVGAATLRAQALALLLGPQADVLLVDIGLPDGSGIDVIYAALKVWPRCGVMVTTAFADELHVMQCIEAGAVGYLLKDSSPENIVEEIRNLHQGGSPISPLIARRVLQRLRPDTPAQDSKPMPLANDSVTLSARETEVLQLVAKGFSYEEIGQRMAVSRQTVLTFVRRIYAKLEVNSQMEAVSEARRIGLLAL
jgi:DNA-binding NarL/FixJ family response regulator